MLFVNQGSAPDLRFVESAARMIASIAETNKIVVEKSTVPVKAAESVLDILRSNHKSNVKYQVTKFKLNMFHLNLDKSVRMLKKVRSVHKSETNQLWIINV